MELNGRTRRQIDDESATRVSLRSRVLSLMLEDRRMSVDVTTLGVRGLRWRADGESDQVSPCSRPVALKSLTSVCPKLGIRVCLLGRMTFGVPVGPYGYGVDRTQQP